MCVCNAAESVRETCWHIVRESISRSVGVCDITSAHLNVLHILHREIVMPDRDRERATREVLREESLWGVVERETSRQRDRETDRERQTGRGRDRDREGERQRETQRTKEMERDRKR